MPFGLRNVVQPFQHFMDQILRGLPFSYTYIDDLLVASATPEEHLTHLQNVFECLTQHGIIVNPSKCLFGASELVFLRHHINRNGITPLQDKFQVVCDFPQLNKQEHAESTTAPGHTYTNVRSFKVQEALQMMRL